MNKKDKKAKVVHDIWSHWMRYFFTQCLPTGPNGTLIIPRYLEDRWKRLMETDFEDLTEEEKKSDYEISDKYLNF